MKVATRFVVILTALLATTSIRAQDEDHSEAVKGMIRAMYREVADGDFEAALSGRIMIGATGYLRDGLLREAPDEETLDMVVAQYEAAYEGGMRIVLIPSHINVRASSRGAVATFLLEGTIKESDDAETISVIDRASHLWLNVEGEWKLAHFHYSELTLPNAESDDEDEDDDDEEDEDEEDEEDEEEDDDEEDEEEDD